MSTYDGAYSNGRMQTIYGEVKEDKPVMSETERLEYEKQYQDQKDFDFAGHLS